jgi:hypothetical protein
VTAFIGLAPQPPVAFQARDLLAQEAASGALSKSELVRLVVSGAYSTDEKIAIVSGVCLSFAPTAGDWADLRALEADADLVDAVERCAELGAVAEVSLNATRLTVRAGGSATVVATVRRRGQPEPSIPLELRGSGAASNVRLTATTDADGRASFRVQAGSTAGRRTYDLRAAGRDLRGTTRVDVVTIPGAAAAAAPEPDRIEVLAGTSDPARLQVEITDSYGNRVSGVEIELVDETGAGVASPATTDASGKALFEVSVVAFEEVGAGTWELRADNEILASVPFEVAAPPPEPAAVAGVVAVAGVEEGAANPVPRVPTPPAPDPADVLISGGYASLADGEPVAAEEAFRTALGSSPRRADGQKGLAEALLAQSRLDEAIVWYEVAVRQDPDDPDTWESLGRAYSETGRNRDARAALARAQELDPSREQLESEIADLGRTPGFVEGVAWGGNTFDNGASGGLRRAELLVRAGSAVEVWGVWDKSLGNRSPELIRGPDEWDALFGGLSVEWGTGRRLTTAVEAGQRKQAFDGGDQAESLKQNVYRLHQSVRLSGEERGLLLSVGGYLGRWFDRDDWIISAGVEAPVGRQWDLVSSVSVGETIGTNWVETGRHADTDSRLYIGLEYGSDRGLTVKPQVGLGQVDSDREEFTGTLVDLLVEAGIPVAGEGRVLLFARHQRPPGSSAFTVVAGGLGLRVGW